MGVNPITFSCEGQIDSSTGRIELYQMECNEPEMERLLRRRLRNVRCWNCSLAKIGLLMLLTVIGSGLAGLYGVLHNQVSYSVGQEYFTKIKFQQLGIADDVQREFITLRQGAALVGFICTWWVGAIIVLILGTVGMIHSEQKMFSRTMRALFIVLGIAVVFGLVGLGIGLLTPLHEIMIPMWQARFEAPNRVFAAGLIHNASYLGGVVGLLVAIFDIRRLQ